MYYDVVFKLLQFDTFCFFFFFNDTATTEIYTLSLHDALPIFPSNACPLCLTAAAGTELAGASSEGTVRCRRLRSEEHTSELQSRLHLVCRLLLEKKKNNIFYPRRRWPQHHLITLLLITNIVLT